MKIIKINESQRSRLFEAYREGFSFKELSLLSYNWEAQYEYCVKWLGEPDGYGSSRCVFSLNDNMVLKLAFGGAFKTGIAQNKQEYEVFEMYHSPFLTRVYFVDDNYTYLVSENVVPAKEEDFEKVLKIPFWHTYFQNTKKEKDLRSKNNGDIEVGLNKYFKNIKKHNEESELSVYDIMTYIESNYVTGEEYYDEQIERAIKKSKWLYGFKNFVEESQISDFAQVENFGLVNRDGKPTLVILDSGLNMDVWEKYYNDSHSYDDYCDSSCYSS